MPLYPIPSTLYLLPHTFTARSKKMKLLSFLLFPVSPCPLYLVTCNLHLATCKHLPISQLLHPMCVFCFMIKQPFLAPQIATVTYQAAIGTNYTMTGHYNA